MNEYKPLNLTLEDGQRALAVHVLDKGHQLKMKYGTFIDEECLKAILLDEEFVRYPTEIKFDSSKIDAGLFGVTEKIEGSETDKYNIYIHEYFKNRWGDVPALVFYHLVTINYGDFASSNEAEEFASSALGLEKDYYYNYICRLADMIPKEEESRC